jgi:hypothetical protein
LIVEALDRAVARSPRASMNKIRLYDAGDLPMLPALIQVARVALPIGLQFGSFVPLWYFSLALLKLLDIPEDAPVKDQPYGWFWFASLMVEMVLLQLAGFTSGRFLSALILRHGFGPSWATLIDMGECPRVLARWLLGPEPGPAWGEGEPEEDLLYDRELDVVTRLESDPAA